MAQYGTGCDIGDIAVDDVQVRSADGRRCHSDDHVGGGQKGRIIDALPGKTCCSVKNQCFHPSSPDTEVVTVCFLMVAGAFCSFEPVKSGTFRNCFREICCSVDFLDEADTELAVMSSSVPGGTL
nr:hypothetical protein [Actinopolyspora mortivallis]